MSSTLSTSAARRRDRIAARLDGAAEAEVSAAALAVLVGLARRESRRIPPALAAVADADDVAQRAALRLFSTTDGALTLAALTSASLAARDAATRHARGAVRSIVGGIVRDGTIAATVAADALTATTTTGPLAHRGESESERVRAALDHAGRDDDRLDGDRSRVVGLGAVESHGRNVGRRAGRRAGLDADAAESCGDTGARLAVRSATGRGAVWERIRENTTDTAVRIVRTQSLETMLTATMRTGLPGAHDDGSAGRTLSGVLSDTRDTAAPFRLALRPALDAAVSGATGRGADALRTVCAVLAARDADAWRDAARDARRTVLDADDAARRDDDAARTASAEASATRGDATKRAARDAATVATASAARAAHALDVWQVTALAAVDAATGRTPTLDALVWLTLTASADGGARSGSTGGARRRAGRGESAARSTLSTAVLLDVIGAGRDTASATAKGLRAALDTAVSDALDAAHTVPTPSLRLALQRAHTANHGAGLDGRRSTLDAARADALDARRAHAARRGENVGRHVTAALRSAIAVWSIVEQ